LTFTAIKPNGASIQHSSEQIDIHGTAIHGIERVEGGANGRLKINGEQKKDTLFTLPEITKQTEAAGPSTNARTDVRPVELIPAIPALWFAWVELKRCWKGEPILAPQNGKLHNLCDRIARKHTRK
jgi:hypothetical protein